MCVYLLDRGQFGRVPDLISSADPDSLVLGQLLKSVKTGINKLVFLCPCGVVVTVGWVLSLAGPSQWM